MIFSYILLLPLLTYDLYISDQNWRKPHSVATAAMTSHSDVFTYNVVDLELTGVLGSLVYCCGTYTQQQIVIVVGLLIFSIISPAQSLFHLLICVERYLAVIHPVTYLRWKQVGGVRIRNQHGGLAVLFWIKWSINHLKLFLA